MGGSVEPAPPPLLSLRRVTLGYRRDRGETTALLDASFDVREGDRLILLGPSGCGKSTLLKAISGFITPAAGEMRLDGQRINRPGPDRMMVFQEFDQLLPWKTVRENIVFPLVENGTPRASAMDAADDLLERVGLRAFATAYPHTLSGGMKQRVAIARALALRSRVLLMDEPFAALDALSRRKMQDDLLGLWQDRRFTLIFVTHSIEEAVILGSRILLLTAHPGRILTEIDLPDGAGDVERAHLSRHIHAQLFGSPAA